MKFKSLYINGRPLKSLSINGRKVWSKQEADDKPWLKFTAEADGSSVAMKINGTMDALSLVYSTNGGNTWQDFIVGETTVNLDSGDSMYLKASKDDEIVNQCTSLQYGSAYHKFVIGGLVKASGNIMTLLRGDGELDQIPSTYCFSRLFSYCSALTQPPELPAMTLSDYCYYYMFVGCSLLTQPPELPATTLTSSCYSYMFQNCTSLVEAPELPATTLGRYCYYGMFYSCRSLIEAPELPATTLTDGCYREMFYSCTSLVKAPSELPATNMPNKEDYYRRMFYWCTSLVKAPNLKFTTPYNNSCVEMFKGCNKLNEIKIAYTGEFKSLYFSNWVDGVSSTGTFYYNGSDTTRGTSAIPNNWTIQTF